MRALFLLLFFLLSIFPISGEDGKKRYSIENFIEIEEALKSRNPESVSWAAGQISIIGSDASVLTDSILASIKYYHINKDDQTVSQLVMALSAIGPKASKAVPQLKMLLSEKIAKRFVTIALIKIASSTIELANNSEYSEVPVFVFQPCDVAKSQFFTSNIPKNALKKNYGQFLSYALTDLPLELSLKKPLLIGENYSLCFWWRVNNLTPNHAVDILTSDLVKFKLSKNRQNFLDITFKMPALENIGEVPLRKNIGPPKANIAAAGSFNKIPENHWNNIIFVRKGFQHSINVFLNGEKVFTGDDFMVWSGFDRNLTTCFPRITLAKMELGGKPYDNHLKFDPNGQQEFSTIELYDYPFCEAAAKEKFTIQKQIYCPDK